MPGDIDSSGHVSLESTDAAPDPGAQFVITRVNRSLGFVVAAATSTKMPLCAGVPDPVPFAQAPRLRAVRVMVTPLAAGRASDAAVALAASARTMIAWVPPLAKKCATP